LAVRIRLKRCGTKNRGQWRVVVADARMPRDGRFIEEIGQYDPLPMDEKFIIQEERLDYWLKQGARLSTSVRSLLKRVKSKAKKTKAS
jgi:small subunit ribosomal protein S16